jgi:pyridoxamine 5'-phosphate oxidase-like protein
MESRTRRRFHGGMTSTGPTYDQVLRALRRRSFGMLGTASPTNRPHVAGVLYALADGALWVSTSRASRKARNLEANPAAFFAVPVRRLPVGPPSGIQFAATAEILRTDDADVRRLAAGGQLKAVTGHGELELEGGCFLRLTPGPTFHTYGIGMPLHRLIRDPLNAGGSVRRPA